MECLTQVPRISNSFELLRLAQTPNPNSTTDIDVINTRTAYFMFSSWKRCHIIAECLESTIVPTRRRSEAAGGRRALFVSIGPRHQRFSGGTERRIFLCGECSLPGAISRTLQPDNARWKGVGFRLDLRTGEMSGECRPECGAAFVGLYCSEGPFEFG
jgi:hypothetical protein